MDLTTALYEEQEAAMVDHHGYVVHSSDTPARGRLVINELTSLTTDTADVTDDDNFHVVLQSRVQVSSIGTSETGHFKTKQTKPINHQTLASRCWMISPEKALQTINVTTQCSVRTCLNPTLAARYPTNDRQLRYAYHIPYSVTQCLQGQHRGVVTSARKYLPHPTDGRGHFQ